MTDTITEADCQKIIARWCLWDKNHVATLPNVYLYSHESDIMSVTAARLSHVFEIKVSRSDLQADFKNKRSRHMMMSRREVGFIPSYFWFFGPESIFSGIEIPEYAGIMVPHTNGMPRIVRQAPRLHSQKISEATLIDLLKKIQWKYWRGVLS